MEEAETVQEQTTVQTISEAEQIRAELNSYLSELDKVFIPEDLDANIDMGELVEFKSAGLLKVIPSNYALVTKNIFTQKMKTKLTKKVLRFVREPKMEMVVDGDGNPIKDMAGNTMYQEVKDEKGRTKYKFSIKKEEKEIKPDGLKLTLPFLTKTIIVPKQNGIMKFSATDLTCIDEEITANIGVVMRISNPAKYMYEGKHKAKEIKTRMNSLLKSYISINTYDSIRRVSDCDLHTFDPSNEFENMEKDYGISVEKVIVEKIELSAALKKAYDDKVEEEKRREADKIKAERTKILADAEIYKFKEEKQIEVDTRKQMLENENEALAKQREIENAALDEKINAMITTLTQNGYSKGDTARIISDALFSDGNNNTTIIRGLNSDSQNIAAASAVASQNNGRSR